MSDSQVIDLTEDGEHDFYDPRTTLEPVVTRIIDALGGIEQGEYRMGEQANACLKDLKKLWRRDDLDDDRTIARIFWERRLLQNDLIPILLVTAGKGLAEDKRAISCVDLITAMSWPIDMAEELKELDEEEDKNADFTQFLEAHLHYKSALVAPGVMSALFNIIIPPLSKPVKERTERDGQLISVILHLIRNLAFVKDLRQGTNLSAQQLEFTSLHSRLIKQLQESNFIDFIITIAANTEKDPWLNGWNTVALEILYLLFRGVTAASLVIDPSKQPREKLKRLLASEARLRREAFSNPPSRHSRFGTTISITLNPNKKRTNPGDPESRHQAKEYLLHRQQGISKEAGDMMDITKRQKARRGNTVDELSREDNLSVESRVILKNLADEFLKACFNSFLSTLLKDIRLERAKVTEKDKLRLLFVTTFFLEYFLALRAKEQEQQSQTLVDKSNDHTHHKSKWPFGLIAEVIERDWIVWILKRMREAVDEKPKQWTELQAGIECLTQLLVLIEGMSKGDVDDPTLTEAADILQQQIIYNGEVLDIALDSLRAYREGSQSLAYLDASVHLAYTLMRLLERWSKVKGDEVYVRKKTIKKRRKTKGITEEEGIPDVEDDEDEERVVFDDTIQETLFTFEAFEMKFSNAEINHTLLTYLTRYKEFETSERMRRVVSLLHRQAVRAKAEGLFFNVSTLDLFKSILAEKDYLPREQPYKDLVNLINFILRKFFKALAEDTFLAVEAFFPKNRGNWKQYSTWEPEEKDKKSKINEVDNTRFPPDVQIKKGYSWSDQLGIAIAVLVEANQIALVNWTLEILKTAETQRRAIIEETDKKGENEGSDEEEQQQEREEDSSEETDLRKDRPSTEALSKMKDYFIPYLDEEHAVAATKNPNLKLLFRLCKFAIMDEGEDELQWYVPATVLPTDLRSMLNVIGQFLETPFDVGGKKASEYLNKKRRSKRRRRAPSPDSSDVDDDEENPGKRKRKEKKKKEKEVYKSAQFIQDSDDEYGDMDKFLEKEKVLREKAALAGAGAGTSQDMRPVGMKSHGTKKRRRRNGNETKDKDKVTGAQEPEFAAATPTPGNSSESGSESEGAENVSSPSSPVLPRPKPRATRKNAARIEPEEERADTRTTGSSSQDESSRQHSEQPSRVRKLVVLSDEEDS